MWAGADIEDREGCASRLSHGIAPCDPNASMAGRDWWPVASADAVKELESAAGNSPSGMLRLVAAVFRARRSAERDADTGTGIGLGVGFERGPGATLVAGVAVG